MRRALAIALSAGCVALALASAGAGVRTPQIFDPETETDCIEPVPAAAGVPLVVEEAGLGEDVDLGIRVLLDGVSQSAAETIMAEAAESYAPLGITLSAVGYESVSFAGHDVTPGNPLSLVQQSKDHFGGSRPAGTDIVFLITSKNISVTADVPGLGPVEAAGVLGIADCIGGVRYPSHAFGVAEVFEFDLPFLGVSWFPVTTSLTVAHEIGHLMGGQHHLANCAEGAPSAAQAGATTPCTLMFNDAELNARTFGTLNAAVVRGHAEEWATP